MNAICGRCWMMDGHPPPNDPDELHRYKRYLKHMFMAEYDEGQSRYDAHREAWAQTGDLDELDRMLRHMSNAE